MNNHKMVVHFNQRVLGITPRPIGMMQQNEFELSLTQLREEVDEMELAYKEGDFVKLLDGMIDLNFFLLGVVYKHGVDEETFNKAFQAVYEANMEKKLGVKQGREGFGGAADAVKPEGWVPPEDRIQAILMGS